MRASACAKGTNLAEVSRHPADVTFGALPPSYLHNNTAAAYQIHVGTEPETVQAHTTQQVACRPTILHSITAAPCQVKQATG